MKIEINTEWENAPIERRFILDPRFHPEGMTIEQFKSLLEHFPDRFKNREDALSGKPPIPIFVEKKEDF